MPNRITRLRVNNQEIEPWARLAQVTLTTASRIEQAANRLQRRVEFKTWRHFIIEIKLAIKSIKNRAIEITELNVLRAIWQSETWTFSIRKIFKKIERWAELAAIGVETSLWGAKDLLNWERLFQRIDYEVGK